VLDTVHTADGLDGIRAFHRVRPDIVVVDVVAPRLDGYELLRRIREIGDTPVVMLARTSGSAEIVRALRAGADDFMLKPLEVEELAARVEALADSSDWKETAELIMALQEEWKATGPVPKDKADEVWKRFRAACDKIYGKARAADSAPAATANEPAPQGYSAPKLGDLLKK
jgi:DNA-binding response OmpR family regulator